MSSNIKKKNAVTTLSQTLQLILLRIHQYRVRVINKPGPDLFRADWLSRQNHKVYKDAEVTGLQLYIDAIQTPTNIPDCMTIHKLQQAMSQDEHLQCLKEHIIQGWPENRDWILKDMRTYWTFWDNMAVIDKVTLKVRHIVIRQPLQRQVWILTLKTAFSGSTGLDFQ